MFCFFFKIIGISVFKIVVFMIINNIKKGIFGCNKISLIFGFIGLKQMSLA